MDRRKEKLRQSPPPPCPPSRTGDKRQSRQKRRWKTQNLKTFLSSQWRRDNESEEASTSEYYSEADVESQGASTSRIPYDDGNTCEDDSESEGNDESNEASTSRTL
ncbi:hypothetical protein L3X38_019025 [Prunus dulcis]|uniref:Uncharacterized protein n=1 Tax=Prunus dulcis TaxID=3755 RepID=A0AAD4WAA4_PRUDU|nr:hypothetical protein L3X38_019025 [Prunus dulcis]